MSGMLIAIGCVGAIITWKLYHYNKNSVQKHDESYFLMMNDSDCCDFPLVNSPRLKKCKNKFCMTKLMKRIIDKIDESKSLICIAMYMLTNRRFGEGILRAHQRGVKVRLICDSSMAHSSNSQLNHLQEAGVAVRIAGNGDNLMHHKFCLIDVMTNENTKSCHPSNGVLINGSLNWTSNGLSRNSENVLFIVSEDLKQQYKHAFDYMWKKHSKPTAARVPKSLFF